MSLAKWLGAFGLSSALLVSTGCGQTSGGQRPSHSAAASSATPAPSPSASVRFVTAKDAAVAAMVAKTGSTYSEDGLCPSGQACLSMAKVFGNADPSLGFNAAYVQMGFGGTGGGSACFVYLFYDSASWHLYPPTICSQQGGYNPILGYEDQVQVAGGGCANVRQQPNLSSKVVACIKNGTTVAIDTTPPRYVDGHIWWSVNHQQGFMAHDSLIR